MEWKELDSLVKRNKGIAITAGQMADLASPNGDVRVFAAGQTVADIKQENLPINCIKKGPSIIVKSRGYIDFEYYKAPFTHKNEMWSYTFSNEVIAKFVFYYLTTKVNYFRKKAKANSVKLPQLCVADTDKYLIPIPSLSEQARIVGILDTFTSAIDNLKLQISQRKKQYEHYRDKLLDLEGKQGVEMESLENMGSFYSGLAGKSKKDFENGNAKFITYMNVFNNKSLDITAVGLVQINDEEKQNKVRKGDILFTASSETPEEAGMSCVVTESLKEDFYMNSFCFGLRLYNPEKYELNYLKHLFRSLKIRKLIYKTASGVTRFNISKTRFGKISVPIPPKYLQKKLYEILDIFDKSISNLESQLALRQKQYEYYRNKLLTFE